MNKTMGDFLRQRRTALRLTQKQLAERLNISDKAVSKWECNAGLPDIGMLSALASLLQIDIDSLLRGEYAEVADGGNMKNCNYYVCPECGNISFSTANAEISCCGRRLQALQAVKAAKENSLTVQAVESEWYISSEHPMSKDNFISFVAFAAGESVQLIRQYPEWNLSLRLPNRRHGRLLWYSKAEGLLYMLI